MSATTHTLARLVAWMRDRGKDGRRERSDKDELWFELMKGLV